MDVLTELIDLDYSTSPVFIIIPSLLREDATLLFNNFEIIAVRETDFLKPILLVK